MSYTLQEVQALLELAANALELADRQTDVTRTQVRRALEVITHAIQDNCDYGGTSLDYYVPPEEL